MKKSKFLEGAMVATVGIIICKILGVVYAIPFYRLIDNSGKTMYSCAYSIYAVFLTLSSTGIPLAISKMVSEYNALGYYNTKERVYKIGKKLIVGIGFISFLAIFLLAPYLAEWFLGSNPGAGTLEGSITVIRIVATALLIVPVYSVTKGYLQGHKYIVPSSISQVIEQFIRVLIIIAGSYLSVKVFGFNMTTTVGIAVFGATAGALVAYTYLINKIFKNKDTLNRKEPITREEAKLTNKVLLKKIIFYALPFILIDLVKSAYSFVDTVTVVRTFLSLGKSNEYAQTTFNVMTTLGTKLNMIVIALAMGITISLIPNVASSYAKNDMEDVNKKVNQSLQLLLLIVLPLTVGISFLAKPVWTIFYGYDALSVSIFKVFIFQALSYSFFTVLINLMQTFNNTKVALATIAVSFILKALLNIPSINLCSKLGIPLYIGPISTTIITQLLAIIFLLIVLKKKYKINYKDTPSSAIKIVLCTLIMLVSLLIINMFMPLNNTGVLYAFIKALVYGVIGIIIYFVLIYKSDLVRPILGTSFMNKIEHKLKNKKE